MEQGSKIARRRQHNLDTLNFVTYQGKEADALVRLHLPLCQSVDVCV